MMLPVMSSDAKMYNIVGDNETIRDLAFALPQLCDNVANAPLTAMPFGGGRGDPQPEMTLQVGSSFGTASFVQLLTRALWLPVLSCIVHRTHLRGLQQHYRAAGGPDKPYGNGPP